MNPQTFFDHFERLADAPNAVARLREMILQLAVQGKLVRQNAHDEPASILLKRIHTERESTAKAKSIKLKHHSMPVKESHCFTVPTNWQLEVLGNLVEVERSISYGVLVPGYDIKEGVPFVRLQDLDVRNPNLKPSKAIAPEIEKQYVRTRLKGGEILLGVVGSIGKLGVAPIAPRA